jgi:very-long-chain (3R)-3-hydroxyacyl-CoA dehydratase
VSPGPLIKVYLIAFNVVSFLGWSFVLYNTVLHLASYIPAKDTPLAEATVAANKIWKFIVVFLAKLGLVTPATPIAQAQDAIYENIPAGLLPIVQRAKSLYDAGVGEQVKIVQSLAVLEVVHVLLGLVRSSLATTMMQVASRLYLVWGVAEKFPEVRRLSLHSLPDIDAVLDPLESALRLDGLGVVRHRSPSLPFLRVQFGRL